MLTGQTFRLKAWLSHLKAAILQSKLHRPHSTMDSIRVSEAPGPGSIPGEATTFLSTVILLIKCFSAFLLGCLHLGLRAPVVACTCLNCIKTRLGKDLLAFGLSLVVSALELIPFLINFRLYFGLKSKCCKASPILVSRQSCHSCKCTSFAAHFVAI